jgi:hypothetical protein
MSLSTLTRRGAVGLFALVVIVSMVGGSLASTAVAPTAVVAHQPGQAQHGTHSNMAQKGEKEKKEKKENDIPTLPAPDKTMGSVVATTEIFINDSVKSHRHRYDEATYEEIYVGPFRYGITKLNKSTFVITHTHGTITKRWYTSNRSIWKKNGIFSDVKGWPGRIGSDLSDRKRRQLTDQVRDTPVWEQKVVPFARTVHEQKAGTGFPFPDQSVVLGTVTIDPEAPLPDRPKVENIGEFGLTVTKIDKPDDDRFVITHRHGNLTKNWTITNSSISLAKGQTGLPVEFAGNEDREERQTVYRAVTNHPVWENKIVPFAQTTHYRKVQAEKKELGSFIPSPWGAMKRIITNFANSISDDVARFSSMFEDIFFTVPAPGERKTVTTWADPGTWTANSWWTAVWQLYWALAGVMVLPLVGTAVYQWSNRSTLTGDPLHNTDRVVAALKAVLGIICGWIIIPAYLHGMNAFATGLSPDLLTLLSDPGSASQFVLGIVTGAVLLAFESGLIITGMVVLYAQWLAIYFAFALFPLAVTARATNISSLQTIGDTALSVLLILPLIKVGQTLILRFLTLLPMNWGVASIETAVATIIGVTIAFFLLPIWGTKYALPSAVQSVGGSVSGGLSGLLRQYGRRNGQQSGTGEESSTTTAAGAAVRMRARNADRQVNGGSASAAQRATPTTTPADESAMQTDFLTGTGSDDASSASRSTPSESTDAAPTATPDHAASVRQAVQARPGVDVTVDAAVRSDAHAEASAQSQSTSRSGRGSRQMNRIVARKLSEIARRRLRNGSSESDDD